MLHAPTIISYRLHCNVGMCSGVGPQESLGDPNFGLDPILNWLRVIGIDLKRNQSNGSRILFRFYPYGWLLGCFYVFFMALYLKMNRESEIYWMEETKKSRSVAILSYIDWASDFIGAVGILMSFLFPFRKRWNNVWNSLEEMRHLMSSDFTEKLRRISVAGVVYIITSVQFAPIY